MVMHIVFDDSLIYHFNEEIEEDSEKSFKRHNTPDISPTRFSKISIIKRKDESKE